jgi:hypothetical protein
MSGGRAEVEIPDSLPVGGWCLDPFERPRWLPLEAYIAWEMAAAHQHIAHGWHPSWIAKSEVAGLEISTVFLSWLGALDPKPFELWIRGPDRDDFYHFDTADAARVAHWCFVWQLHLGGDLGRTTTTELEHLL